MRVFGYARAVDKLSLDKQRDMLSNAGVKESHIYIDEGDEFDNKSWLRLMQNLTKGDVIIVRQLGRLGDSGAEVIRNVQEVKRVGASIKFLDDNICTTGVEGEVLLSSLQAVERAKRHKNLERANLGRSCAKARGVKLGRKRSINRDQVQALFNEGVGATDISRQLNIGRSTVYQILRAI